MHDPKSRGLRRQMKGIHQRVDAQCCHILPLSKNTPRPSTKSHCYTTLQTCLHFRMKKRAKLRGNWKHHHTSLDILR